MFKAAIITVSDKGSQGEREDKSGELLLSLLMESGFEVAKYVIIPDEQDKIINQLQAMIEENITLVITSGGTGLAPRDETPEATRAVIEKDVPGIQEEMRRLSIQKTPHGMLSRGIAGIKDQTLIINFPGSPKAVKECFQTIEPALKHALETLTGNAQDCAQPEQ